MPDDPAVFLSCAREEPGDVHKSDDWQVEAVAEPNEPRGFGTCIDVENSGQRRRLLGDDTYGPSPEPREGGDDVRSEQWLHLEQRPTIKDPAEHAFHIVGNARISRNHGVEFGVGTRCRVTSIHKWRVVQMIGRQI